MLADSTRGSDEDLRAALQPALAAVYSAERAEPIMDYVLRLSPRLAAEIAKVMSAYLAPPLDLGTRRLLTIAVTAALGRTNALRTHIEAALDNGMDPDLIDATICHVAMSAGFPAAIDAMQVLHACKARSHHPQVNDQ